jgi:hypothetical protein
MGTRRRLVLCNATAGTDAEFNKWYNEVHCKELISLDGYKKLTRYQVDMQMLPPGQKDFNYMSIWDFTDIDQANKSSAAKRSTMTMSPTLDMTTLVMCEIEEIFSYKPNK